MPPTASPARLVGVDATRGAALVGMMAVHVLPATGADGQVTLAHDLAGGRAAATFAVLAGVGLALANGRQRPLTGRRWAGAALSTAVRGLLIGLVGLLLALPETGIAIVLAYYGALFLLAGPLLGLGGRGLTVLAVAAAVAGPVLSWAARDALPRATYVPPTPGHLLEAPGDVALELALTGYYPVAAWLAYLAAGLAVGRLPLAERRVQAALLGGGALLAATAAAVSGLLLGPLGGRDRLLAARPGLSAAELSAALEGSLYGTVPTDSAWWLAVDAPHSSTPLDLLGTTGTALSLLGAMLLLARVARGVLAPLAAAGSMTLTLYSAHVLAVALIGESADREVSWLLQVALALALATAWRRVARRGPLEALVAAAAGRAGALVAPPAAARR